MLMGPTMTAKLTQRATMAITPAATSTTTTATSARTTQAVTDPATAARLSRRTITIGALAQHQQHKRRPQLYLRSWQRPPHQQQALTQRHCIRNARRRPHPSPRPPASHVPVSSKVTPPPTTSSRRADAMTQLAIQDVEVGPSYGHILSCASAQEHKL